MWFALSTTLIEICELLRAAVHGISGNTERQLLSSGSSARFPRFFGAPVRSPAPSLVPAVKWSASSASPVCDGAAARADADGAAFESAVYVSKALMTKQN